MKFYKNMKPTIYYQGVDTLRTAHVIKHVDNYFMYERLLQILSNFKDDAIASNANYEFENGISFDLSTFGKFFIRPKGQGRYKFVIYNQDIEIYFSTVKYGANDYTTPQIVVDYRARYLSLLGYEKAYSVVCSMLETLLSTDENNIYSHMFNTQLMRIDLCTDVGNIDYTPIDKYRFQTNFKSQGHIEFKEHFQFNRLTGFSFGKGDYMMRIYNKRHELNNNASKLWLTRLWVDNGYDENIRPPVWRHEVQMRRPYLKMFRKEVVHDEVLYFFDMLPNLWTFAFSKVSYVDITTPQAISIMEGLYTSDNLRQLFYRTKKKNPSLVWEHASYWKGLKAPGPEYVGNLKKSDISIAKRFYKSFISTAYKATEGDPYSVLTIMDKVQEDLQLNYGTDLHDYGENKVLGNFIDNAQYITNNGFTVDRDFRGLALKMYEGMRERFLNLGDPLFDKNEYRLARMFNKDVFELRETVNDLLQEINHDYNIVPLYEMEYIA